VPKLLGARDQSGPEAASRRSRSRRQRPRLPLRRATCRSPAPRRCRPSKQIYKWKRQLIENIKRVFESEENNNGNMSAREREAELMQKIGELTVERDVLSRGLGRLR
jgi:hypothetical protein